MNIIRIIFGKCEYEYYVKGIFTNIFEYSNIFYTLKQGINTIAILLWEQIYTTVSRIRSLKPISTI